MDIGWKEWVSLPQLKISLIKAKIDTGAKTSALHTYQYETFDKNGVHWIRFWIHPKQNDSSYSVECESEILDKRSVTNSGGITEERYVIRSIVVMGNQSWPIEITLANRDTMRHRMLLGREALQNLRIIPSKMHVTKKPNLGTIDENSHPFPKL
ncbi:ATP-dependent zinc protease [Marinicella sp. W31]|uniref:ATP-dependent zinc protease family protein n=1 Tax=Marinicella sp. W31 TaxID=3023713 RepID=UPI003756F6E7